MCIRDRCLHTLSDVEDLPGKVGTDCRFEKLSTDRSDCRLSFAAPVGVLLSCNHVYNQFIFIDDHAENLKNFEQTARNMQSLRSVDSFSNRQSVPTFPGKSSTSESRCV